MPSIQFKTNQVLFKGDQVSFCATDCTCGTGHDPTPTPPTGCPKCKAAADCVPLACTPFKIRAIISGSTTPAFINCVNNSHSVALTAGTLNGTYDLLQDPNNPCRWLIDLPSSSLTATGYTAPAQGGTTTTTNALRVALEKRADGFLLTAVMIFPPSTEFVLFSGFYSSLTLPDTFTISGASTATSCDDWQFSGGRLATNGSAAITVCPAPPAPTCSCVDLSQPTDITVSGVEITDCDKFTPYTGDDSVDPSGTSIAMAKTGACTWTGTGAASGKAIVTFDITYDVAGELGCGYYGVLTGDLGVAGYYFKPAGTDPGGTFTQYFQNCTGTPATLTVTITPVVVCPTTITVTFGSTPGGLDDGTFMLTHLSGKQWEYTDLNWIIDLIYDSYNYWEVNAYHVATGNSALFAVYSTLPCPDVGNYPPAPGQGFLGDPACTCIVI